VSGDWLALGFTAAMAALSLRRRGSRDSVSGHPELVAAYEHGFARGQNAANWTDWPDAQYQGADPQAALDSLVEWAWEAQENSRSYSPFEHTAAQFNRAAEPQVMWQAYRQGVADGVRAGARERLGLPQEQHESPYRQVAEPQPQPQPQPPPAPRRKITRDGFPWPEGTVLYHGTAFGNAIRRQGFRTRQQGAVAMAGGGHQRSVSTTLLPQRAAAIALGLDTMARVAQRKLSLVALLDRLCAELDLDPEELAVEWLRQFGAGFREALDRMDRGWVYFHYPSRADLAPAGSWITVERQGASGLAPPGSRIYRQHASKYAPADPVADAGYQIYRHAVSMASFRKRCFNPLYIGTDAHKLSNVNLAGVGVWLVRALIPRVCTDMEGAVALGYVDLPDYVKERMAAEPDGPQPWHWTHNTSEAGVASGWYSACASALDPSGMSEYDRRKAEEPLLGGWDARAQAYERPWPHRTRGQFYLQQSGDRSPSGTMLYYPGEQEVRIFDTGRIELAQWWSMPDIRWRFKLGDRLTFPWLDGRKADIRIWPPGVRRQRG
jgi:hypothetical protein